MFAGLAALMCANTFNVFVELLTFGGVAHVQQALLASLSANLLQASSLASLLACTRAPCTAHQRTHSQEAWLRVSDLAARPPTRPLISLSPLA